MRIEIAFQSEMAEFDVPEARLVAAWAGPPSLPDESIGPLTREALESPLGYPALRQAVVPGDRVVIPVDPATPGLAAILGSASEILTGVGVDRESIRLLLTGPPPDDWPDRLPAGLGWSVHDPESPSDFAYLASTPQGRRVYLNRHVTDADFVLPIGQVGFDDALGMRGPWSVIFPGLSNAETRRAFRVGGGPARGEAAGGGGRLEESAGVSWLLGSQLQVAVVPGASRVARVLAGAEADVQEEARKALEEAWTFRPERRAELVVVGIGRPDRPAGFDELAEGLATASGLVEPGGKIAVLSRVAGTPGAAVGRLLGIDDPRSRLAALKGREDEPDYAAARSLARSLARADIYLFSGLGEETVEDLGMVALGKPGEVRRLVAASGSSLFVSRAESTRAVVVEEAGEPRGAPER